jgi:hypothetical protein
MLKRISLVIDKGDDELGIVNAYLTPTGGHAYFIHEGIVNYAMVGRTPNDRVYVETHASIRLGATDRGDIAIYDLHEKLAGMSALQMLNHHVIHDLEEIDLVREVDD